MAHKDRNATARDLDPPWIDQIRALEGRLTELVSVLRGLTLNDVLRSSLEEIPAAGVLSFATAVPFAAVSVVNLGAGAITISTAPAGDAATPPTSGVGVARIPAQRMLTIPLAGTVLTAYGTAGEPFIVHLSSRPLAPAFG